MSGPIAFISSFFKEAKFDLAEDSPLWTLRRDIYQLKDADEFDFFGRQQSGCKLAWVAEHSEPDLAGKEPLEIADRLIQVLSQSELYICILADSRRGPSDHGTAIEVARRASATSYFEIELYTAAMYSKPVLLFIQEGFSPGPRLESLLRLLGTVFPDWRTVKPRSAPAILAEVRQEILNHLRTPTKIRSPLRKRLVTQFYLKRGRNAQPGHEVDNVLFLDAQFEPRGLPDKDLVESLLKEFERVPEMQRKASRMWIAARELMSASYLANDVQADGRLRDFLPLWDKVLGWWASAAAWSGWHGHIYAGTVAPLHSQAVIRSQLRAISPPYGGLASAYYSIANLIPFGIRRFGCLRRASRYIEEEIRLNKGQNAADFAVRGSIRMRLGNVWAAVEDFKEMLHIRAHNGASEEQLGDSMVHLGFGYLYCGRWLKGRDYLERGVEAMSVNPDNPGLARAKRKLARAYQFTGKFADARREREEANAIALRLGALDQLNRR